MRWPSRARSLVRTLFRQSALDRDLDAELQGYREALEARHLAAGLPPEEARRAALLDCDGLEQTKERVRDARVGAGIESLLLDLRHALRGLRRNPGLATTTILTLALGIGATVAIFSVVRAVLLRPLPYKDPEHLVFLWDTSPAGLTETISPGRLLDLRAQAQGFAGIAGVSHLTMNLVEGDRPERLFGAGVSTNFFEVLGVAPLHGRGFDVGRENQEVIVLSHALWTRRFGGDPAIVGRTVTFDSGKRTVIGVMPSEFFWRVAGGEGYRGPQPQFWVPAPFKEVPPLPAGINVPRLTERRDVSYLRGVARLEARASLGEVNRGLTGLAQRLAGQHPDTDRGRGFRAVPAMSQLVGSARTPLILLLGAVCLVLGVACVNVANLLLGRALARRGEVAVRLALGAGRLRLARQFVVESLVIASIGAGLGVLLAHSTLAALVALSPRDIVRLGETRVDGVVLLFAVALAVVTALAVSLAPVLDARRVSTLANEASRRGGGRRRTSKVLLVGEVAMATTLVIGAGLLLRSLDSLRHVDVGIKDPKQVLTFVLALGADRAGDKVKQQAFYDELLQRLSRLPGVRSVGAAITLPMDGDGMNTAAWLEGEPAPKPTDVEGLQIITPGYFETLGVPIVAGRDLTPGDRNGAPRSILVNEAFVRKHRLTLASVLGRRVRFSNNTQADQWTIVGVSRDVKHFGPALPPRSELFVASAQQTFGFMSFVVRAEAHPVQLASAVRSAVAAIDSSQPITDLDTLQASLDSSVSQTAFLAKLLSGFGAFALVLAAVGIYGVMNWSVVERRREIGVRVAVGASTRSIATMVLRQGAGVLAVGLAVGFALAAGLSRLLSGLLFDVAPGDLVTYTSALGVLSVVALVALWLPAHRASRVDAVAVLHE